MKEKKYEDMVEKRIFLTFEKVYGRDINDFRYKICTGRLLRDSEILMGIYEEFGNNNTIGTFCDALIEYINSWGFIRNAPLKELEDKGWINDRIRKFTLKVVDCYENNFWDLNKKSGV